MWNGTGNRYYVNGKRISITISEVIKKDPNYIREMLAKYETENTYKYFDEIIEKWVYANREHYDYITTEAKQYGR